MFVNQLLASVASVARNGLGKDDKVHIYLLHGQLGEDTIKTVLGMRNPRLEITSAAFNRRDMDFMQQFTKNSPTASARSWSGKVFARLWIPLYLKGIDRCIYLDTDTLVRKPLRELWNVDLQGKAYGMAMGSVPEYGYNSGVMLMDLRKVDVAHNWKSLCEHMRKYAATYMLPDQTVINRYYAGQIFELPKKFNYPPRTDVKKSQECQDAVIWHFYNGGTKPAIFSEADWCKVEWNSYFK